MEVLVVSEEDIPILRWNGGIPF